MTSDKKNDMNQDYVHVLFITWTFSNFLLSHAQHRQHNTHKRHTSMQLEGFKSRVAANKWRQIRALNRAATEIGTNNDRR